MKRYPCFDKLYFSYLLISLFYFCTFFIVINATGPPFEDINDVSNKLRVIHYDCSKMKENKMYALTQVSPCKITPENIQMVDTHVTLYQRSYRTFVKALMCKVTAMLIRYNCGMFSHSSIVHNAPIITYNIIVSPEQCLNANKTGKITVTEFDDEDMEIDIKHGIKTVSYKNQGVDLEGESSTSCDNRGQIKHFSFETLMQEIVLDIDLNDRTVYNSQGLKLPCALSEGGCHSTSLDPFAYNWEAPENCIVTKRFSQNAKMLKHENELGNVQYFIVSDEKSETPYEGPGTYSPAEMDIKIRVIDEKEKVCGKPEFIYRTNLDSLYVSYKGGFNMKTGKPYKTKTQKFFHKLRVEPDNSLSVNGFNRKPSDEQIRTSDNGFVAWEHLDKDKLDYDLNLAVKMDFVIYHNYMQIKQAWKGLVIEQCELDRTKKQMILMQAIQNNRLAGYMLTGNRSMFLDTDGSIGWLYHCPKRNSPLQVLEQCYDRIPIHYDGRTMFVDPITRQTYPFANEVDCVGGYKNAYQLDIDNENSWYHLMPAPVPLQPPKIFSSRVISSIPKFTGYESQRAGIYTPNQLKSFWDNILHSEASKSVLTKISREVLEGRSIDYSQKDIYASAMGINRQIYLHSLLSPTFFTDQFKGTFGIITFYLEKIGVYFACFLCIKFLTDVIVTIIRAFEIHKISNKTMGFWKILLGATYNLCILSFFTPVFSNETKPSAPQNNNHFLPLSNYQPYSTIEKTYKCVEDQPRENKIDEHCHTENNKVEYPNLASHQPQPQNDATIRSVVAPP